MAKEGLVADRPVLSLRPQAALKQRLEQAAGESGRSMARDAEVRLEASFTDASAPDLRTLIREEICAALAAHDSAARDRLKLRTGRGLSDLNTGMISGCSASQSPFAPQSEIIGHHTV